MILRQIIDYLFTSCMKIKKFELIQDLLNVYTSKYVPLAVNIVLTFYPSLNNNSPNIILFTGEKKIDNTVNSLKSKCLQFISLIIQLHGNSLKNQTLIDTVSNLSNNCVDNLTLIVNSKLQYLSLMDSESDDFPDYNYESLLFQIMLYLSRFLIREPIVTHFTPFVKK